MPHPIEPIQIEAINVFYGYGPAGTVQPGEDVQQHTPDTIRAAWQYLHETTGLVSAGVPVNSVGYVALHDLDGFATICSSNRDERSGFFEAVIDETRKAHDNVIGEDDMVVVVFESEAGRVCNPSHEEHGSTMPTSTATHYGRDIVTYNGPFVAGGSEASQEHYVHEFGHAIFDLRHNERLDCASQSGLLVVNGTACLVERYGDPYTVMGKRPALANEHLFHAFELRRLGLITEDHVTTFDQQGEHEVRLSTLGSGEDAQVLRIPLSKDTLGEGLYDLTLATALYAELSPAGDKGDRVKLYLVNENPLEGGTATASFLLSSRIPDSRHALQQAESVELLFEGLRLRIDVEEIRQDEMHANSAGVRVILR